MTTRFLPPTRSELSNLNGISPRLIRAFEQLWKAGGQDLSDLQEQADANTARIKTNEVLLWLSM